MCFLFHLSVMISICDTLFPGFLLLLASSFSSSSSSSSSSSHLSFSSLSLFWCVWLTGCGCGLGCVYGTLLVLGHTHTHSHSHTHTHTEGEKQYARTVDRSVLSWAALKTLTHERESRESREWAERAQALTVEWPVILSSQGIIPFKAHPFTVLPLQRSHKSDGCLVVANHNTLSNFQVFDTHFAKETVITSRSWLYTRKKVLITTIWHLFYKSQDEEFQSGPGFWSY